MQPGASGEDGGAGAVPLQGHKGPGQQLHHVKVCFSMRIHDIFV
jgi:hypothetical protein